MKRRFMLLSLSVAVLSCAAAVGSAAALARTGAIRGPEVRVRSGTLLGVADAQGIRYLGVPYAAAPIGARRFKPPAAAARWSGVRAATQKGPQCIQFDGGSRYGSAFSEDCLFANVFLPRGTTSRSRLPVLFYIHGGGNVAGSGSEYDGRRLAQDQHIAVVTISYRLGMLGGLALPQLSREQPGQLSGNYLLQDQIAGLRWVKANIQAFGGDPRKVTVSGQSAGGADVCSLLAAPSTRGLFRAAIIWSPGACGSDPGPGCTTGANCSDATPTVASAYAQGARFAAAAGCEDGAGVVACLRRASVNDLLAGDAAADTAGPKVSPGLLPRVPLTAFGARAWHRVPVLIGSTHDEGKWFMSFATGMSAAEYTQTITEQYGDQAAGILQQYPVAAGAAAPAAFYAFERVFGDPNFSCATQKAARLLAAGTPTYRYEFDDPHGPTTWDTVTPGVNMSNGHIADLAYIFDTTDVDQPLGAASRTLSRRMMAAWGSFVKTENPNKGGGARPWPAFTGANQEVLSLRPGGDRVTTGFVADHHCAFWGVQ
jgi:para-nitrobenzyl esterase